MRLPLVWFAAAACAFSLAHCSHDSNTLTVSPPLPPAEEPSDDTAGAYVGDAGANTPEGAPKKDAPDKDGAESSSADSTSGGSVR
ncbi:MAG TPA: hypothetical protein VMG12_33415 [Polyangiaceae bacterium]|nr:hypothetical protein [Polyangiaceae bacterium]